MDQDLAWHGDLPTTLVTDRLVLRALAPADASELATVIERERDHLAPWIGLPDAIAELPDRIAELAASFAARTRLRFLVRLPDGTLVGCVGIDVRPARRAVALTYWLAAGHTGRGYASEATAALCDLVVQATNVERLEIWCHRDNAASARVARNLGFARGGDAGDAHVWCARPAELRAWHHVRRVASQLGAVTASGDRGVLRLATADGELDLAVATVEGEPYVMLAAAIGSETLYAPRASLAHNATLAIGSLVIVGGLLQLRYGCAPLGITRGCLALLLHEAHRLRRPVRPQVIHPDTFACAL